MNWKTYMIAYLAYPTLNYCYHRIRLAQITKMLERVQMQKKQIVQVVVSKPFRMGR